MKKLRCAVVGVGYLGRFHAQKYQKLETAELVGVFDANADRCKEVALELGVKAFTSIKELVGAVDAATVASTTQTHYENAKFLLQNGIHVNVEKPMTVTPQEASELCEIAAQKKLKLQVGHVERFNPAFIAVQGKLERPLFMEVHRLSPFKPRGADVDVVLDLMIHDLDVILHLVNSKVKSVQAVGISVMTPMVDIANARLEFESGAVANVTASRVSQTATRKFRVFQENQYLSIDFGSGEVTLTTKTGEFGKDAMPLHIDKWNLEKGDALFLETEAFVDAIQNNKPTAVSGQDGLNALELAERIRASIHERNSQR